MKCFNHHDTDAIGICKACGKGVCAECAVQLHPSLACKDSCEERVNLLDRIVDQNDQVLKTANSQIKKAGLYSAALGILFIVFSFLLYDENGTYSYVPHLFGLSGACSLIYGFVRVGQKEQYPTEE